MGTGRRIYSRNLISGLSHLDITLVGICEELNITITGRTLVKSLNFFTVNSIMVLPPQNFM